MGSSELLSFNNEVFASFALYSTVVTFKMMSMSFLTVFNRIRKKVFTNPEDCAAHSKQGAEKLKPVLNDPDVERVRRNHLNDMENIPPFLIVGILYVLTSPTPWVAIAHFRAFAIARILHTLAYQIPIPQPARGMAWLTGFAITVSMGVQVLMKARGHA